MEKETFGTFFTNVKEHAQNWFEARIGLYKLKGIRIISKIMGNIAWLIISLFLLLLFSVFAGLTLGFWLSSLLDSYAAGFGIVSLLILLKIWLLYVFRKPLFINPIIRIIIRQSSGEQENDERIKN